MLPGVRSTVPWPAGEIMQNTMTSFFCKRRCSSVMIHAIRARSAHVFAFSIARKATAAGTPRVWWLGHRIFRLIDCALLFY